MAELILEPYAVTQYWRLPPENCQWETILAEYLETLAHEIDQSGPCIFGHIKALALFPHHDYVQISVISPTLPATITGKVPCGCMELALSLNVIVYGLEYEQLERITDKIAVRLATKYDGEVKNQIIQRQEISDPHQHH